MRKFKVAESKGGYKVDLLNLKFGKLLVIDKENHPKYKRVNWKCKCDCGNIRMVPTWDLRSGKQISCGCARKTRGQNARRWTGYKDIPGHIYQKITYGARKRNLKVEVSIEDIWQLFIKQDKKCALSGLPIKFAEIQHKVSYNHELGSRNDTTASLDRIDSEKGYTIDNIQWVHRDINLMKNYFKQEYFLELCNLIVEKNND